MDENYTVTDEEMVLCLSELTKSSCMLNEHLPYGCMSCPSQRRNAPGCILRIYKNKLKKELIAKYKQSYDTNVKDIEHLKLRNNEYETKKVWLETL
jgi:hypothetical protein